MPETINTTAFIGEGEDKKAVSCQINYEFGATLEDAISLYGKDVVFALYRGAAKVKIQGIVRGMLEREESNASIEAFIGTYRLGTAIARVVDPKRALATQMANMADSDALDVIKNLIAGRGLTPEQISAAMNQ